MKCVGQWLRRRLRKSTVPVDMLSAGTPVASEIVGDISPSSTPSSFLTISPTSRDIDSKENTGRNKYITMDAPFTMRIAAISAGARRLATPRFGTVSDSAADRAARTMIGTATTVKYREG